MSGDGQVYWASQDWLTSVDDAVRNATFEFIERLREEHGDLYLELLRIASEEDPIGLAAFGAPPTEYEPEVRQIVPHLRSVRSTDELASLIHAVFVAMFDPETAGPVTKYKGMAQRVWTVWKHTRL